MECKACASWRRAGGGFAYVYIKYLEPNIYNYIELKLKRLLPTRRVLPTSRLKRPRVSTLLADGRLADGS
jgi:hypothetical protein